MAKSTTRTKYIRFRSEVSKGLFRVPISITRESLAWLNELSVEMKTLGGYKLPKSYVIRAMLNAMIGLNIDVSGVKTEEDLTKRIKEAMKKCK